MIIKILTEGGNMSPGPALSQKLGPAGINMGQVIQKVNEATKNFKGIKVPIELDINTSTKEFEIKVFSPPVSESLKKELKIEKGSGLQEKEKVANASIEQIILIAKTKMPNLLCKDLRSAVKSVVGTCVSLGILIENKPAAQIEKDIDNGLFDKEISKEKTETSDEKRKELDEFFSQIKSKQEQIKKQEQIAAEEAAKVAESTDDKAKTEAAAATPATPAKVPAKAEAKPAKKK